MQRNQDTGQRRFDPNGALVLVNYLLHYAQANARAFGRVAVAQGLKK